MRTLPLALLAAMLALAGGCEKPQKLTPEQAAAAQQATAEANAMSSAAVGSRYQVYRWMTPAEMVKSRLGYDPSQNQGVRIEVQDAVNGLLQQYGYRQGSPADFVIAFTDSYLDRNRMDPGSIYGMDPNAPDPDLGSVQTEAYSDLEVYRYPEEQFGLLFFDARTRKLLWRGWGKEELYGDQQTDEEIDEAVLRALNDMPVPLGN